MRRAARVAAAVCALLPCTALAATATPNDPYYGVQWALHGSAASTGAPSAWCESTGAGVLVADIDTGVDFGHPDLQGRLVAGAAFTSGSSNPDSPQPDATGQNAVMDDYGHGTMTTGIIVANTGNGTGISGEAYGSRTLVMKVFSEGATGYGAYDTDIGSAIHWAVQHGARVINLSLGPAIPVISTRLGDQTPTYISWAADNGAAVAIAAGNDYIPAADYTTISGYALVVGALGPSGAKASYSQSGSSVNIDAPGGDGPGGDPSSDIISTFPTYPLPSQNQPLSENVAPGYAAYDGTSFATPYTAGVLAMLMARGYTAAQARQRILDTATPSGNHRVLDAAAALGPCGGGSGATPAGRSGAGAGGAGAVAQQHSGTTAAPTTSAATASATTGHGASASGGVDALAGGGGDQPPSAHTAPAGGPPTGLLLAGLALLLLVGGPALVVARRRVGGI